MWKNGAHGAHGWLPPFPPPAGGPQLVGARLPITVLSDFTAGYLHPSSTVEAIRNMCSNLCEPGLHGRSHVIKCNASVD